MNALMANVDALHWLRPQWLWSLLVLPLLWIWWRARQRQRSAWRDTVDAHLLPHLLEGSSGVRANRRLWLPLLGGALAICALAGPSLQRGMQPLWQSRAPLVIALDLSSATLAGDLPPSRLLQARAKIATLLRTRAGGQVGLVAFADDAYTVAPLTEDAGNVAVFLDALEPDVMPVDGSRADRAVAWSAKLLRQAGFGHGDILLLTDHADAPARDAAATAVRQGYRVSVLGLGTPDGAAYRDADGRIAHARLDAASLTALARAGDGTYAGLRTDDADLLALGVLLPRQAAAMATHGEKTSVWRDQGYWLLPPLMLLVLFAFRRGGVLALLLVCAWLPLSPAHAQGGGWWLRPDQQAHARMEQGADAYRRSDFANAQAQWSGLPGADAAYNRGNALARQGDYDGAIAAYDAALQQQPGMADAIANRRAVDAARKRRPPPGSQQRNNGRQAQQQSGQNSGRQDAQPGQRGNASSQDRAASSSQTQQAQAGPMDKEAQRAADAAQKQRMQEALRQADARAGQGDKQTPRREEIETAAQRERRLADEAWLRRVPDDPGGLLRAKFRLEYERRQQGGE